MVMVTVTRLLCAGAMHASEQASCTFDTFSAPSGYTFSQVNGVSDDGTVVGQLVDNGSKRFVAFQRSSGGIITTHAAPQSSATWLYGRNAIGDNAGFYQGTMHPENVHGFLLQGDRFTTVEHPRADNTWLFHVNALGASVGSFTVGTFTVGRSMVKGFLLLNGNYTTIAFANARVTYALALNDKSDVVGTYASGPVSNGFLWQRGTFTTINYPRAKYGTVLTGVNNSGVIVGNQLSTNKDFGFIYENGEFKDVVYSGAKYTMAGGINNNGLISGQIYRSGKDTVGYTAVCK